MLFAANICFAAPQQEADEFFKDAVNVESLYDMGTNSDTNNQPSVNNNQKENSNNKSDFFSNISEISSDYLNQVTETVKTYSIQINDYANEITNGNKMLSTALIITVLTVISIFAIVILLLIFKAIFRKKKKNPFEIQRKEQISLETNQAHDEESDDFDDDFSEDDNIQPTVQNTTNVEYSQPVVMIDEEIMFKNEIIQSPTPQDIKSAIDLFVKITSK